MSQMLRQAGSLMQTATISVEDRTNGATTTLVQVHAGVPLSGPTPELSKDFIISDDVDMEGRRWHVSTGLTAGIASSAFGRGVWLRQIAPQFTAAFLASLLLLRMRQNRARDRFDLQVVALSRNFLGATNAASRVSGTSGLTASGSNDGIADEHFDAVCREIWESGQTQQYFEPVINLRTGDLVGFESLLRIRGRSDTPPIYKFIEWAERAGHIRELTRRSVAQAFDQIERFQQQSGTLEVPWISVNISATDLGDDEFVSRVVALTHVHPKTQGYIKLEITESVLLVDIEHTVQRLQLLRSAGLRIALDDFGTGYASLSYLRQLPIDTLKIDRSFISPVGTDTTAREIVKALVALAGKLNLDVIAEGIEDAATASAVLRLGCKQAQGYLFPRAAPADTVVVWVTRRHRFLASILSGSPSSGRIEPQRNSTPSTET